MPLKDYSFTNRMFGNILLSMVGAFITIIGLILLNLVSIPLTYFIFPSYFVLLTLYSEISVRRERKLAKNSI